MRKKQTPAQRPSGATSGETPARPRKTVRRPGHSDDDLESIQQSAISWNIPETTIRDLHFRGFLPVVKLPGCRRWLIRRGDMRKLIEKSIQFRPLAVLIPMLSLAAFMFGR